MSKSTTGGSDQIGEVNTSQPESDHQISESSKDSSESSESQSDSGSGSDSSTWSSSDNPSQQSGGSVKQSSVKEHVAFGSEHSNESYKSFNASAAKSGKAAPDIDDLATPSKPSVKHASKTSKGKSPTRASPKAASPVPITPAKALNFTASPSGKIEIDFSDIVDNKTVEVVKHQPVPPKDERVCPLSPGELSGSDSVKPKAASVIDGTETAVIQKRGRQSSKSVKNEVKSPDTKRTKKDKVHKIKSRKSRSVEKVERQMKALQKQLDKVRGSKLERGRKSKKKRKAAKSPKVKKSKPQSSDDKSSCSSGAEEPTTSSRIGKIPMSRKLQGLAMERSKQLGALRLGDVHITEVSNALKKIKTTVFPTDPTQAYRNFNFVPGVGYPHVVKQLDKLQSDVGSFVGLTAKLNLNLAQELHTAKKHRIGPEADNEFMRIWQFGNDLARAAVGLDKPAVTPTSAQSKISDKSKVGNESASDVRKSDGEQQKKAAIGADMSKELVASKARAARKRKNTGSKTEVIFGQPGKERTLARKHRKTLRSRYGAGGGYTGRRAYVGL